MNSAVCQNISESEFSYAAQASGTRDGGGDYELEGVGNIVLVPERLAVRAMAFYSSDSGFLKRTFPVASSAALGSADNQGATETAGASLSMLFKVTDNLDITFRELYQRATLNGWQVAYASLSAFEVTSLTLNGQVNVQERGTNQFSIPSLEIAYRGDAWSLASSTSFAGYETYDLEDGTEGMGQVYLANFGLALPPSVPITVGYTNTKQRLTHETRVLFGQARGISGVAGIYFSNEHSVIPKIALQYEPTRDVSIYTSVAKDIARAASYPTCFRTYAPPTSKNWENPRVIPPMSRTISGAMSSAVRRPLPIGEYRLQEMFSRSTGQTSNRASIWAAHIARSSMSAQLGTAARNWS